MYIAAIFMNYAHMTAPVQVSRLDKIKTRLFLMGNQCTYVINKTFDLSM